MSKYEKNYWICFIAFFIDLGLFFVFMEPAFLLAMVAFAIGALANYINSKQFDQDR